ncbi:MAG: response regulator [Lachnospiraceae bacterium]|nr:response regulator [Lachnospiraceae bacterium]
MEKTDQKPAKRKKSTLNIIFAVFFVMIVLYMLLGQVFSPNRAAHRRITAEPLNVQWVRVFPDGTREPVELPQHFDVPRGEQIVIESVLPDKIDGGTWIALNSLRQEIGIYIDGKLRQEFSTVDTGMSGKYSAMAYVFMELDEQDAGRPIRITWMTESMYTGRISEVYCGERLVLWAKFFSENLLQAVMAIFLFLFSVIAIIFGISMGRSFQKPFALEYLGWGILLTAVWMLCESRLRQLFFTNVSVVSDVAFLAAGLMPFPYAEYFDRVQRGRYRRCYWALKLASLLNFCLCTALHVMRLVDFSDSMRLMHIMIFATLIAVGVTIGIDIRQKRIRDYIYVFIGYIGLLTAVSIEVAGIYCARNRSEAMVMASILLFVMAMLKTSQDISELEREKQEALATNRTKTNFLANMSHEIRTPINTIIGMNQMILRESAQKEILEYANNVDNASKLLITLVNDILDFSKIESGKLEIVEKSYQLASLLNDEVHLLETKAEKKNLQISVSIDESLPSTLVGDDMRIRQVITNLITNAVKYTGEGSISLTVYGEWLDNNKFILKVAVQDTGIGIRKEDQERLFQRFVRFDIQKNSTIEGSGLGLAITKRLVDLMRGEIHVESEYGKGSTFYVSIPQEVVSRGPVGSLESAYQNEVSSRKKYHEAFHAPGARILVVDDNTMNLAVVKGLLKRTEIVIDTATSGTECLYMTRKKKYHLIFMDHMMPEMDGIQTFHLLREEKDNPNLDTKVIALTANAIAGSREEYMREGFVDYISKPIDAAELEIVLMSYLPEELVITAGKEREQEQAGLKTASTQKQEGQGIDMQKQEGQEMTGMQKGQEMDIQEQAEQEITGMQKGQEMDLQEQAGQEVTGMQKGQEWDMKQEQTPPKTVDMPADNSVVKKQDGSEKETDPADGNKKAYIDRAVGLTHCMDMEDMYAEILQDYCSEGKKYQEKLSDCMEKEDWKNFTVYVHAVKSSSNTIGAEAFGEEARVLEMASKEGNIALIRENWNGFLADFKAVITAAEKLFAGMQ